MPTLPIFPGVERGAGVLVQNASSVAQVIAAATRTYIVGSNLAIPLNGLKVGAQFYWTFNMTKTAAGTATSTFDVCVGTTATTAATARCSFTKPVGTAAVDEALVIIEATVRVVSVTAGVIVAEFVLLHNLAATGHATIPVVVVNNVSSVFDNTAESLIVGVCITSGASDAITIEQVNSVLAQ